jgi:hypothetical protein
MNEKPEKWRAPFIVRKLEKKWCVLERLESGVRLVGHWKTRRESREAVRQLNEEERRYA